MPPRVKNATGQVHLRLDPALYERLSKAVEASNPRTSLTGLVEFFCDKGLKEMENFKKRG